MSPEMNKEQRVSDERLAQLIGSAQRLEFADYLSAFRELQSLRALQVPDRQEGVREVVDDPAYLDGPFYYVPMPLNAHGRGPEMDASKVVCTQHEVWNGHYLAVATAATETAARAIAAALSPQLPAPSQEPGQEAVLPCDISLSPATIIRKGCKLSTLHAALEARGMLKHAPISKGHEQRVERLSLEIADAVMGNPTIMQVFGDETPEADSFKSDVQIEAARVLRAELEPGQDKPVVVTEEMVERALTAYHGKGAPPFDSHQHDDMRAALTAALNAGGNHG